jgi:hypothetical protein
MFIYCIANYSYNIGDFFALLSPRTFILFHGQAEHVQRNRSLRGRFIVPVFRNSLQRGLGHQTGDETERIPEGYLVIYEIEARVISRKRERDIITLLFGW